MFMMAEYGKNFSTFIDQHFSLHHLLMPNAKHQLVPAVRTRSCLNMSNISGCNEPTPAFALQAQEYCWLE